MWLCGTIHLPSNNHLIYYLLCPHSLSASPSQNLTWLQPVVAQKSQPWPPPLSPLQPLLRSVYAPLLHTLQLLHTIQHLPISITMFFFFFFFGRGGGGIEFLYQINNLTSKKWKLNVNIVFLFVSAVLYQEWGVVTIPCSAAQAHKDESICGEGKGLEDQVPGHQHSGQSSSWHGQEKAHELAFVGCCFPPLSWHVDSLCHLLCTSWVSLIFLFFSFSFFIHFISWLIFGSIFQFLVDPSSYWTLIFVIIIFSSFWAFMK